MSNVVSTNLAFSFATDTGGEFSLENWDGFVGMGSVALSLYDSAPGPVQLFATIGEVQDLGVTASKPVPASFVQVNGSNTASIDEGAEYEIMFALDSTGTVALSPQFVSRTASTVTFSEKFWGLIHVKAHTKSFKVLKYTPHKTQYVWTYGVVAAYKNGNMAICHVNAMQGTPGNDELEIYRIESEMLINGDGEWEKPDGWPDKPSYPNGARPPKPKIGVISTRIHEIGMVTAQGYFYSRTFDVRNAKPYFGDASYKPKTTVVQGSGFSKLSPEMKIKAQEAMVRRGKGQML